MMKKIAVVVALSTLAAPVMAEGFYVLGSVGQSYYGTDSNDLTNVTGLSVNLDKNDIAYKLQLGYQFNPYFAVEGGYVNLGKVKATFTNPGSTGSVNAEVKVSGVNVVAVGILPVNDQFSVFGKLGAIVERQDPSTSGSITGVTFVNTAKSETKTKGAWGLGVNWEATRQVALRAEFEQFLLDDNVNVASIGVAYKF